MLNRFDQIQLENMGSLHDLIFKESYKKKAKRVLLCILMNNTLYQS